MTVGVALRGHPIPGDRSLIGVLIVCCEEGAAMSRTIRCVPWKAWWSSRPLGARRTCAPGGRSSFAAAVPVFIGLAFNAVLQSPPDYTTVGWAAVGILVTQLVRSAWQMGRNFGSEVIGQRLERDARAEL